MVEVVGPLLASMADGPIEDRVLQALRAAGNQAIAFQEATEEVRGLRQRQEMSHKDREAREADVARLVETVIRELGGYDALINFGFKAEAHGPLDSLYGRYAAVLRAAGIAFREPGGAAQLNVVERLAPIHHDLIYHEQPGVSHWWDLSDEPGADCVDWPPLFDFFARHARPLKYEQHTVDFSTANPSITSSDRWVTIVRQERQGEISRVVLQAEPFSRRISGTTQNITLFSIDLGVLETGDSVHLEIDGQRAGVLGRLGGHLLFEQAMLIEGMELKSPTEFVKRLNRVMGRAL